MPEPTLKGIVYSTSNNNPTINSIGTSTTAGTFIATINTTANKTYYIKAYTTNSGGTSYSNLITVKSAFAAPDVTQQPPTTTILTGKLDDLKGSTSAAVGFIISIAQAPVTNPASITTATPSLSTTLSTFLRIENNANATTPIPFIFTKDINSIGLTSGSYNAYAYAEVSPTIYSYSLPRNFIIS